MGLIPQLVSIAFNGAFQLSSKMILPKFSHSRPTLFVCGWSSVTRYGEISPPWQNFGSLWHFKGLPSYYFGIFE